VEGFSSLDMVKLEKIRGKVKARIGEGMVVLEKHGVKTGWERGGTVVLGGTARSCCYSGSRLSGIVVLKRTM